jgi:hypothetical protein
VDKNVVYEVFIDLKVVLTIDIKGIKNRAHKSPNFWVEMVTQRGFPASLSHACGVRHGFNCWEDAKS